MNETEILIQEYKCRYCLEDDDEANLITPCDCKGSMTHVHEKCLRDWIEKQSNQFVIPGYFSQEDKMIQCEVCKSRYRVKVNLPKMKPLWLELTGYFILITVFLFLSYICFGMLLQINRDTGFFYDTGHYWTNVLLDGFFLTHIILGVLYIFFAILQSNNSCFICYCGDCGDCNSSNNDGIIIIIGLVVVLSVLCTMLLIYVDVSSRLLERREMFSPKKCTKCDKVGEYWDLSSKRKFKDVVCVDHV
jgi:E3 ubiquitin-protein ligase DOA10